MKPKINLEFGLTLKDHLTRSSRASTSAAELANKSGVSKSHVYYILNGERLPSYDLAGRLIRFTTASPEARKYLMELYVEDMCKLTPDLRAILDSKNREINSLKRKLNAT